MTGVRVVTFALVAVLMGGLAATYAGANDDRPWLAAVPSDLETQKNPIPISRESVGKGKLTYENACLSCHGAKGKGDGPAAQYLERKPKPLHKNGQLPLPDGVMHWVITNGIEGTPMASMSDALTEEERWHVINYLHAMAKHYGPRTPRPTPRETPAATPDPDATPDADATPVNASDSSPKTGSSQDPESDSGSPKPKASQTPPRSPSDAASTPPDSA